MLFENLKHCLNFGRWWRGIGHHRERALFVVAVRFRLFHGDGTVKATVSRTTIAYAHRLRVCQELSLQRLQAYAACRPSIGFAATAQYVQTRCKEGFLVAQGQLATVALHRVQ